MRKNLMMVIFLVSLLVFAMGCGNEDAAHDEDDHEHGDLPYEWSGEYTFSAGSYTFDFKESGDDVCAVAFLLLDGDLGAMAHYAHHIMETSMDVIELGGSFTAEPEYGYVLSLNPEGTVFTFEIVEAGEYVLFMEHVPHEFDLEVLDSRGSELEAGNPVEYEDNYDHGY